MADQRERSADETAAMKVMLDGFAKQLWTSLPAIVTAYDSSDNTISAQPAIKATVLQLNPSTGAVTPVETALPLLIKVPVHQIGGGGFVIEMPPAEGDEVTILFSSRNIDGWWQSGGVQSQIEQRTHDLSDGIAIPGLFSAPKAQTASLGKGGLNIRSLDGATKISLAGGGIININAPSGINIVGDLTVTGKSTLKGDVATTGALTNNTHDVGSLHMHTATQPGTGKSGPPQ